MTYLETGGQTLGARFTDMPVESRVSTINICYLLNDRPPNNKHLLLNSPRPIK